MVQMRLKCSKQIITVAVVWREVEGETLFVDEASLGVSGQGDWSTVSGV